MPESTPDVKVNGTKNMGIADDGQSYVDIVLVGENFDAAYDEGVKYMNNNEGTVLIHPFNDPDTIIGQGTIMKEIDEQLKGKTPDFIFIPIGGGGLSAGVTTYVDKVYGDKVNIIGVEPVNDPSTTKSLLAGKVIALDKLDHYIEGASVAKMGDLTFEILKDKNFSMRTVNDDQVHFALAKMFHDNYPSEGAGCIGLAALFNWENKEELKGKNVILILSGSNLDRDRRDMVLRQAKKFSTFPVDYSLLKYDSVKKI